MENKIKKRLSDILRILAVVCAFALIGCIFYFLLKSVMPGFIDVARRGDEDEIQEYIRSAGSVKGYLIAGALQFVQVVSIFFPGAPIQIASGIIFGAVPGYLTCHLSYLFANMAVFAISRSVNRRFGMQSKDMVAKQKKWQFISNSDHPAYTVMLACLVPVVPNGIIPHMAARSRVRFSSFCVATAIGSAPAIFVMCAIGNKILNGDFLEAIILFALMLIAIYVLYRHREKFISWAVGKISKIRAQLSGKKD